MVKTRVVHPSHKVVLCETSEKLPFAEVRRWNAVPCDSARCSARFTKPYRAYKCAFLCRTNNTEPKHHEVQIGQGTKSEMEEFQRGFKKGMIMGNKEACRKMLEMEMTQPKTSRRESERVGITDPFDGDAEPLHDSYINGLQKAMDYLYMRKDPWDEKSTVKVTAPVFVKEDIARTM